MIWIASKARTVFFIGQKCVSSFDIGLLNIFYIVLNDRLQFYSQLKMFIHEPNPQKNLMQIKGSWNIIWPRLKKSHGRYSVIVAMQNAWTLHSGSSAKSARFSSCMLLHFVSVQSITEYRLIMELTLMVIRSFAEYKQHTNKINEVMVNTC